MREPISSSCTATPFNADGAACQGGALGTPFFLFTDGTNPRSLFANAYQPDTPVTGAASAVGASAATLSATVNPRGASVNVSFQYGTTTAYGQATAPQSTGVSNAVSGFTAQLSGLPAASTIHYRAVAVSDFGTFAGADETLTTASPPAPSAPPSSTGAASVGHARVSGSTATEHVSCTGAAGAICRLALRLTVTETFKGQRLVALAARSNGRGARKVLVVGTANVSLGAGQASTVRIALTGAGRRLLARRHRLRAQLLVTQETAAAHAATVSRQILTFKTAKRRHAH